MQEASSERVRALNASTYDIQIYIADSHDLTSIQSTNTQITCEHTDLQQHRSVSGIVFIDSHIRNDDDDSLHAASYVNRVRQAGKP